MDKNENMIPLEEETLEQVSGGGVATLREAARQLEASASLGYEASALAMPPRRRPK